tara:strand:+ start:896 stop:1114 length:219 start_codon:yes stop_codon:yes gene_type:complete
MNQEFIKGEAWQQGFPPFPYEYKIENEKLLIKGNLLTLSIIINDLLMNRDRRTELKQLENVKSIDFVSKNNA